MLNFPDATDTDIACDLWFAVNAIAPGFHLDCSDPRDAPTMAERQFLPNQRKRRNAPERDSAGELPAYAWPGGYPIIYLTADGGTLCPACANGENGSEATEDPIQDDRQWLIVASDVHWEGSPEICDHCNAEIESAYGDPDAGNTDEES